MYNIKDKSEIIYLYNVERCGCTHKFPTLLDALKFLACGGVARFFDIDIDYLSHINLGSDMELTYKRVGYYNSTLEKYNFTYEKSYVSRPYMFVDGYNRIIDMRMYKKKIKELYDSNDFSYKNEWVEKSKKFYNFNTPWRFRVDPVPHTGKLTNSRYYRSIHTLNEKKQSIDSEIDKYVRPNRKSKNLPFIGWDDFLRSRSHSSSWKDCTKKRKQWM